MMRPSPFLLLMPSYNQAHYIGEAVASVLQQDDPHWELWILDNSSDATPEVMKAFSDSRIHFIHEPRRMDPGSCLNVLLKQAQGVHFSYIHTDNNLLPGYVRHFRGALDQDPLALAYCDYFEIDEKGQRTKLRRRPNPFPLPRLFSSDSLGVPFAATVALADRVGGFSSDDLADDCFFTMRADGLGPRYHVREPIVDYRAHGQSRTELSGVPGVARSVYRSALKAYGLRSAELPDPFAGLAPQIRAHVAAASGMAKVLARHLLSRAPVGSDVWIDGTGPASFWLAWACAELGRCPLGFRDQKAFTLLGLPVRELEVPLGAREISLKPRREGLDSGSLGPSWQLPVRLLATGRSPLDHLIKRYPAPVMASLLAPLHRQSPGEDPVWVLGGDALAAYLAYGVQMLAGLPFGGWISNRPVALAGAPVEAGWTGARRVWAAPGADSVPPGTVRWTTRP